MTEDKKLYYTEALQAAYMCKEFGVKFYWFNSTGFKRGLQSSKTILGYAYGANKFRSTPDKFYIHPDSLHVFRPKVGDVIRSNVNVGIIAPNHLEAVKLWPDTKIIQRDDKQFFMPKEEKC